MLDKIRAVNQEVNQYTVSSKEQLEAFRLRFISRRGVVTELFETLKTVSPADRKELGQALNTLKNLAQERFQTFSQQLDEQTTTDAPLVPDLTLPAVDELPSSAQGLLHR